MNATTACRRPVRSVGPAVALPLERRTLMSAATHAVITAQPSTATAGDDVPLTVALEDDAGNVDTSDDGVVSVAIVSGPTGATLGGFNFATASGGVATYTYLELTTSGTYTLQATASGLTPGASTPITVTAGAAYKLVVASHPTSTATVTAGAAYGPVVVDVADRYGNPITTADPSTVTVIDSYYNDYNGYTSTKGPGGTTTQTTVNGVATFSDLTLTLLGPGTLTFADGSLGGATQTLPTVTAGAPATLSFFNLFSTVTAGESVAGAVGNGGVGDLLVYVDDALGNVAITPAVTVTLTAPWGTQTATSVSGIASFSVPVQTEPTTDTLTATAPGLTGASGSTTVTAGTAPGSGGTPGSTTVTVGPAAALYAEASTGTVTAGQPVPEVFVGLKDAHGNDVTTSGGTVTVSAVGTTLGGTTTATFAKGEADFQDLTFPTAGTYTLSFASAGLAPATQSVTVLPSMLTAYTVPAGKSVGRLTVNMAAYFPSWKPGPKTPRAVLVYVESQTDAKFHTLEGLAHVFGNGSASLGIPALKEAGTYHITVEDTDNLEVGTTFTVTSAAPAKVAFATQPWVVNGAVTATVQLYDRYGNEATAPAGTVVSLALVAPKVHGAKPTLGGTVTATVNSHGVAAFGAVVVPPMRGARLTASVARLPLARSDPFDVG